MGLILLKPGSYICHLIDSSQRKKNKWRFMESNVVAFLSVAMSTFVVTQIPAQLSAQQGCFGAP